MAVERDINGVAFLYENKDEIAFEPDPNQLEPIEEAVDMTEQEAIDMIIG